MSYGDFAEIPGHLLVASNGPVDYYAPEANLKRVVDTAVKCQQAGLVGRMLRPVRAHTLARLVEPVESPALWKLEDGLRQGEEIVGYRSFSNVELANEIVAGLEG